MSAAAVKYVPPSTKSSSSTSRKLTTDDLKKLEEHLGGLTVAPIKPRSQYADLDSQKLLHEVLPRMK